MTWVALVAVALFLWMVVRAARTAPGDEHAVLRGNDPAPAAPMTGSDARGAVNRHSWMLGGGGSGG